VSPANTATVQDDVTFVWTDFLETNTDGSHDDEATGVAPRTSAMQYVVEVSEAPNFQTLLDSAKVDQTTYTSYGKTYPEGTLYWRVAALDGSNNRLASSEVRTMTKSSPTPELISPVGNAKASQTEPFRWKPLDFAASYDIEVYKNNDVLGQLSNRVLTGNSKQVAFTTSTPLPASDVAYTWRIRRVDASGHKGGWTNLADATFRVGSDEPTLLSPAPSSYVAGDDALFTWQALEGVTSYRFERKAVGSTSVSEIVNTPALAWAPTKTIADGAWQWRVSTLDAGGKVLRSSAWRTVYVDATAPTVTRKSPTGKVARKTSFKAVFSERVTGVSTTTMRIYQKGRVTALKAKVTLDRSGRTAVLNPALNLKKGKVYTVKLTSSIKDLSGHALVPTSWKVTAR
jgi:hypothetical protein